MLTVDDCIACQVMMLPALQGRLPANLIEAVQAHLRQCAACRAEYDELRSLHEQLHALVAELPPAPDQLWQRLQVEITSDNESLLDLGTISLYLLGHLALPSTVTALLQEGQRWQQRWQKQSLWSLAWGCLAIKI